MAIKVKAVEKMQLVGRYQGQYRYPMAAEIYSSLSEKKVIAEAATRSGISRGALQAAWDACAQVIAAWATEGHSVPVPGLGTMRFGVNATTVATVGEVSASLITTRKVIFTPGVDLKAELKSTAVNITCYDRHGNIVRRVTSGDDGTVEDPDKEPDPETPDPENPGGGDNTDDTGSGNDTGGGGGTADGGGEDGPTFG